MEPLRLFLRLSSTLLLILVAVTSVPLIGNVDSKIDENENILQMRLLGTVEGRSYFMEPNITMTWRNAKTACESFGLQLASVETENQVDFLRANLRNGSLMHAEFWSSAKSAELEVSVNFTFADTGNEFVPSLFWHWQGIPLVVPEYCVTVRHAGANDFQAQVRNCSAMHYSLCYHT